MIDEPPLPTEALSVHSGRAVGADSVSPARVKVQLAVRLRPLCKVTHGGDIGVVSVRGTA